MIKVREIKNYENDSKTYTNNYYIDDNINDI